LELLSTPVFEELYTKRKIRFTNIVKYQSTDLKSICCLG